jgi:hypothetical protein
MCMPVWERRMHINNLVEEVEYQKEETEKAARNMKSKSGKK